MSGKIDPLAHKTFSDRLEGYRDEWLERQGEMSCNPDHLEMEWNDIAGNYCQSPIGQLLCAELVFAGFGYGPWPTMLWAHRRNIKAPKEGVCITAQFPVDKYKVDIAVFVQSFRRKENLFLAIECDGHDWHERTKDQAKKDRQRDRYLQWVGWQTMRFTGAEIFADARSCAEEIGEVVVDFYERTHGDDWSILRKWKKIGFNPPYSNE